MHSVFVSILFIYLFLYFLLFCYYFFFSFLSFFLFFVTDIDECSSNPCLNGGTCTDQVNGYVCSCQAGYTGSQCQSRTLPTYRKIPVISPGLIKLRKGFSSSQATNILTMKRYYSQCRVASCK